MSLEVIDTDVAIPEEIMSLEKKTPDPETTVEETVDVSEVAPKRRGRPPGSKSKEPGKPRAPRAKKKAVTISEEPVATDTIRIEDDALPRALERSQPIPRYSRDETSAMLLQLLSHQANQRKRNKVELWQSWFR